MITKLSSACNSSICIWLGTCRVGDYNFFFHSEIFFSDNTRVRIFIFFGAQSAIFFPEINIRLYDKNSESDFFLFFTTIRKTNIYRSKHLVNLNPNTDVLSTSVSFIRDGPFNLQGGGAMVFF
jgi:hypothetical protein